MKKSKKIHAINPDTNKTFCGKNIESVICTDIDIYDGDWYTNIYDSNDLCEKCKNITKWKHTMYELSFEIIYSD